MLEILAIPAVRERVAPITIERYHRMIDLGVFAEWKVELLNGVLVEKMSRSALHVFLVQCLFKRLLQFCPESEFSVRKEDPITIGDSEPEPDISVVRGQDAEFRQTKPTSAQFVIEVAMSTLAVDRAKASVYAEAEIPEYWIIRPGAKKTEVYRNPVEGTYSEKTEVPADQAIESTALPGFAFHLAKTLAG